MEKKEQEKKVQPLNEAELDQVNGGSSLSVVRLHPSRETAISEKIPCPVCQEKITERELASHMYWKHPTWKPSVD